MNIVNISVVQTGINHDFAVFGLGDDGKPYRWQNGEWALVNL